MSSGVKLTKRCTYLPVAVSFWADGCEPCRQFIPIFEEASEQYAGKIKFVDINIDAHKALADRLGIKAVPTLMLYKAGTLVSNNTGQLDKDRVEGILQATRANSAEPITCALSQ